jgi:hypothetical protein
MINTEEATVTATNNGDHDKFSHYAEKDEIMKAFVFGISIIALCGKIWVPTRDGSKFPVCPECKEVYSQLS